MKNMYDIRGQNRRIGMILIGVLIALCIGTVIGVIVLNWSAPWRTIS